MTSRIPEAVAAPAQTEQAEQKNLAGATSGDRPKDTSVARMQPATALPWKVSGPGWLCHDKGVIVDGRFFLHRDGEYAVHAINAYPRLVAALKETAAMLPALLTHIQYNLGAHYRMPALENATVLLRDLGESQDNAKAE